MNNVITKHTIINYNLHDLLNPWMPNAPKYHITGITLDSRNVIKGDVFIAVEGHKTDGRNYINQAINNGVVAVIAQSQCNTQHGNINMLHNVPIIYLNNLNEHVSALAGRFYSNPSHKLTLVGVTGTNGKTTITNLLAQWVQTLGEMTSVIGTLGNGILGKLQQSINTTPSAIDVQRTLAQFHYCGVKFSAIEISSHGLTQHRVNHLHFDAAIFSNLTRDHMDYHHDMKKYEAAKWRLFSEIDVNQYVINVDDIIGYRWFNKLKHAITVSTNNILPLSQYNTEWISAVKVDYHNNGTKIFFRSSWGNGLLNSPLIGKFNVSNLLLSLASLLILGYPLKDLLDTVHYLQPICGRMEIFNVIGAPKILLDYAHNPDALINALTVAKKYCRGKLWCVFGCGGERDKGKRPLMGAIAEHYADQVIITNDNSREEPLENIINDILSGLLNVCSVKIIPDRIKAITYSIINAKTVDVILIAGKGHENYQIIGTKQFNYTDSIVIKQAINGII